MAILLVAKNNNVAFAGAEDNGGDEDNGGGGGGSGGSGDGGGGNGSGGNGGDVGDDGDDGDGGGDGGAGRWIACGGSKVAIPAILSRLPEPVLAVALTGLQGLDVRPCPTPPGPSAGSVPGSRAA